MRRTIPSLRRTKTTWRSSKPTFDSVNDPKSPLGEIRALAYDVVLNGTELGSGSIRIHRQDIQGKIFQALGMSDEEARSRFGFFLEALEYGTPPHGGIALGLDRIVMILAGADSLREVIPFPKTARAVDLMVDAPTPVSDAQLKRFGDSGEEVRVQSSEFRFQISGLLFLTSDSDSVSGFLVSVFLVSVSAVRGGGAGLQPCIQHSLCSRL